MAWTKKTIQESLFAFGIKRKIELTWSWLLGWMHSKKIPHNFLGKFFLDWELISKIMKKFKVKSFIFRNNFLIHGEWIHSSFNSVKEDLANVEKRKDYELDLKKEMKKKNRQIYSEFQIIWDQLEYRNKNLW